MREPGIQLAKSLKARRAICDATIEALVAVGYAETSLNRVASLAGVSKGAVQHHFPSKEDLICAAMDELLARVFRSPAKSPESVEHALRLSWRRFINTPAYRGLMEILGAARTDTRLEQRISADLLVWGKRLDEQTDQIYSARSQEPGEAIMLMNMTRSFMRGLLLQERYGVSQTETARYVEKWIELIAPLLTLKEPIDGEKTDE